MTVAFWGGATIVTLFRVSVEPTREVSILLSQTSKYYIRIGLEILIENCTYDVID